ncbi:MAG: type II toxin-antitoxin system prevent-host-death family antitoxin [Candidatus Roizmanbacteria bacterium]|nr:type II toxin-antitoxin system prevent-host-death family antitoxin [Candidatus Roizmanbacteria bacterium]
MLIDHNNLVQKTELRQNLAQILARVYKGDTLFISDRGTVKAKITLVESKIDKKKKIKKIMKELNKIRDQLADVGWGKEDSTMAIRKMREERSQYLLDRDG